MKEWKGYTEWCKKRGLNPHNAVCLHEYLKTKQTAEIGYDLSREKTKEILGL